MYTSHHTRRLSSRSSSEIRPCISACLSLVSLSGSGAFVVRGSSLPNLSSRASDHAAFHQRRLAPLYSLAETTVARCIYVTTSSTVPAAPNGPVSLISVSMLMVPGNATPKPPRATPSKAVEPDTDGGSSAGVCMSGLRRVTVSSNSLWQILPLAEGTLVNRDASLVCAATQSMLAKRAG